MSRSLGRGLPSKTAATTRVRAGVVPGAPAVATAVATAAVTTVSLTLLLTLLSVTPAAAQVTGADAATESAAPQTSFERLREAAEIRRALDQLVPRLAELDAAADVEDAKLDQQRLVEQGVRTDTLRVGPLTIVTRADQRAVVEHAARGALDDLGISLAGAEHLFEGGEWGVQIVYGTAVELGIWKEGVRIVESDVRFGGESDLRHRLTNELGQVIALGMPQVLVEWAGAAPVMAQGEASGYTLEDLNRAGRVSGSFAVMNCFQGDAMSCWSVLGFPRSETPALEWYSPEEIEARTRRATGRQARLFGRADEREAAYARQIEAELASCLNGAHEVCAQILYAGSAGPYPIPKVARTSLVTFALEKGGEGALGRLLEADGTDVRGMLEAASAMNTDDLITAWAAEVRAATPVVQENLGTESGAALLWVLMLGGAATAGARRRLS